MVHVINDHPSEVVAEETLARLVEELLDEEQGREAEVTVILCDRAFHQQLHHKYLGRSDSTDVLAFPLGEVGEVAGEVYVDLDTARERHTEFGTSFDAEVVRYAVHGVLHLLGFDDHDEEGHLRMKRKEDEYVSRFSVIRKDARQEP